MTNPTLTTEEQGLARQAAREDLWREGDLSWKLDYGRPSGPQRDFYARSRDGKRKTFVNESARRLGKSWTLAIIAAELALKNPGRRINWCQDTSKGIRASAVATFEKLCMDAPEDCKGHFNSQLGRFVFPNGAYIFIFGGSTIADADTARGGDDPIASFVDEAGFVQRLLKYIYKSILKPAMRLVKRLGHFGMIFLSSSTPKDPDHYFIHLANINEAHGSYCRHDIYSSDDPERYIAEESADAGLTVEQFIQTDEFRREFLLQRVVDSEAVVFPEFARVSTIIVREHPRPIGFEKYVYKRVSVDPGMQDKTGVLFGYVDFTAAKVVIDDELLLTKPNTKQIAEATKNKELELWGETNVARISRVIDDPHGRYVMDLWDLHKLGFAQAVKHDRDASIGIIRTWLMSQVLVIHPRCIELRKQLLTAVKNKSGKDFERTEEGHFDLCAALMYFCRNLSLTTNPYPASFDVLTGREMEPHHPIAARRELMGQPVALRGLAGAILGGNRYVQNQLRRRR
jgi:hypothetical protein